MSLVPWDYLDPGIRETVRLLRDAGFETTDSGDGVSKPEVGRCLSFGHVFIEVSPDKLISEANHD